MIYSEMSKEFVVQMHIRGCCSFAFKSRKLIVSKQNLPFCVALAMAAYGEGGRRSRENDESEWFFTSPYKFRRMNWTHPEPVPFQPDPAGAAAAAAEQPEQDIQDDAAMQPEQQGPTCSTKL